MDRSEFRTRMLMRLATSPVTLVPVLIGGTLLLAAWALDLSSGIIPFAGAVGLLGGLGVMGTRLLTGSEELARDVVARMKRDAAEDRERTLDSLDARLVADGDDRTQACLRDLRALACAFDEFSAPEKQVGATGTLDIVSGVEGLITRCITSLERTLELWETASRMATEDARGPVLTRREKMIDEVKASTRKLGEVLAGLQTLSASDDAGSDLARMRTELDERIEVARRVEQRMSALEKQIHPGVPDSPDNE